MKRLALLATLMAATVVSATATADKLPDVVSIKADQYNCCTQEIFGSVESPAAKCERNRTIILFYNPSNDMKRRGLFFDLGRHDHDRHQGRVPVRREQRRQE